MRISENYLPINIDGQCIAFPVGQKNLSSGRIIRLNSTGEFICKCLENDLSLFELRELVYKEYDCSESEKKELDTLIDVFVSNAIRIELISDE